MAGQSVIKVIAGDIGGTKTLVQLAAFDIRQPSPRGEVLYEHRFDSRAYGGLDTILQEFLELTGPVGEVYSACLGVAGPVHDKDGHQRATLTNLPWVSDSRAVSEVLGIPRVRLVNDFQAVGYGIDAMRDEDLVSLQEVHPRERAPRLIVGAGTGLGVGLLAWKGEFYESYPTEGGHVHFAPVDDEQDALLQFLRNEYGRVSCERLVSGPGLENIYRFIVARDGEHTASQDPLLNAPDPAAAISAGAISGDEPLAMRAMDLFVTIYGQVTGDLALTTLARGGVFVAGGIAPRILSQLQTGRFMDAFHDKGRMRSLVTELPVRVIVNPRVGLLGCALAASRM
ncbi:glucokinase [Thiohalomonas denitrificans]|uniref:Glucokinase n=1 Tax=Thiohalomonas denitrificans TaxID=415747 RepID=A0A1G5Q9W3_9GAMM|nr:glucokinase [Thiohalomonas denitrificans]SCZ58408.1 glucokinase [Thiohalomonas denitrificans]